MSVVTINRLLCATSIAWLALANVRAGDPETKNVDHAVPNVNVQWMPNLAEAQRASTATGKPILIVFGAKWCGFCRKLDNNFSDPELAKYINATFVPLRLDVDRDKKTARLFHVRKLPATLVLTPDRKLLARLTGYRDIEDFHDEIDDALQQRPAADEKD